MIRTPEYVVLADGTELPADLVVYATVGKCWGPGSDTTKDPGPWEGEQRNMWKPTQQEALWFTGGNLHQSRHYSLYLGTAAQGPSGRHPNPCLRPPGGPSPQLMKISECADISCM